eukprot:11172554-Lingulodinium_polyedra.AAC.1
MRGRCRQACRASPCKAWRRLANLDHGMGHTGAVGVCVPAGIQAAQPSGNVMPPGLAPFQAQSAEAIGMRHGTTT